MKGKLAYRYIFINLYILLASICIQKGLSKIEFQTEFKISVTISIQHGWTHILQVLTNKITTF